jgi:hypothetical protein
VLARCDMLGTEVTGGVADEAEAGASERRLRL